MSRKVDMRCEKCRRKLAATILVPGSRVDIICTRCNHLNTLEPITPERGRRQRKKTLLR